MKKRILSIVLTACLLCWGAAGAGAMAAEGPVTLVLSGNYVYQIYPDGYQKGERSFSGEFTTEGDFQEYTGPYIITGESRDQDTCLDFYSLPYQSLNTDAESVEYTVTFQSANIQSYSDCTALRFGNNEGDSGKNITLNLINCGSSMIEIHAYHPAFSNAGQKNVLINLHNAKDAYLSYYSRNSGIDALCNNNVALKIEGASVTGDNLNDFISKDTGPNNTWTETWKIDKTGTLEPVVQKEPTCEEAGQKEYWKCTDCDKIFSDENGSQITTLDALTISALGHGLEKVTAKAPTCTENGNIEYYRCTRNGCGKLFSDADGKTETTLSAVTLPAQHDLTKNLPQTGDSSHIALWIALLLVSGAGVIGTTVYGKKKRAK